MYMYTIYSQNYADSRQDAGLESKIVCDGLASGPGWVIESGWIGLE